MVREHMPINYKIMKIQKGVMKSNPSAEVM